MWRRIINWWTERKLRRTKGIRVDAEAFRSLTREISDLARAAGMLSPRDEEFAKKIRSIQAEMEQLDLLVRNRAFRKLSTRKRVLLRRSLLRSRQQLIETVKKAPTHTEVVQ
jgi:hypothetical protein